MKTITTWIQDQSFTSIQEDQSIRIDGKVNNGMSPKALLLSGLGGCSGIDVVEIITKMKLDFQDLSIEVEAGQTEEHPRVFTGIHITYRVRTAAENRDKFIKAIELSINKYCGVAAMLKKNSSISYELQILQ